MCLAIIRHNAWNRYNSGIINWIKNPVYVFTLTLLVTLPETESLLVPVQPIKSNFFPHTTTSFPVCLQWLWLSFDFNDILKCEFAVSSSFRLLQTRSSSWDICVAVSGMDTSLSDSAEHGEMQTFSLNQGTELWSVRSRRRGKNVQVVLMPRLEELLF